MMNSLRFPLHKPISISVSRKFLVALTLSLVMNKTASVGLKHALSWVVTSLNVQGLYRSHSLYPTLKFLFFVTVRQCMQKQKKYSSKVRNMVMGLLSKTLVIANSTAA